MKRADDTRMPADLGLSQQERDFNAMIRRDRIAVISTSAVFILSLILFGLVEAMQ